MQTIKTAIDSATDSIERLDGVDFIGNTNYEVYSISTVKTEDSVLIVINTNFNYGSGIASSGALDGLIASGDLLLNFSNNSLLAENGNLYGVRFVKNNGSGVPEIGLYENVTAKSVASDNNLSLANYGAYNSYVERANKNPSAGELSAYDPYFDQGSHVPNVIQSGTLLSEHIRVLDAAAVAGMGISVPGAGHNTFAIEIPRSYLPEGDFTASWSPECNNDLAVIRDINDMRRGIKIEKLLDGYDADTSKDYVKVCEGEVVDFTYEVTNTGDVSFLRDQVGVTDDDLSFVPVLDASSDLNSDGILSPGETWIYRASGDIKPPPTYRVDFDTDGFGNALAKGTVMDDELTGLGIHISAPNSRYGAMIFDSNNPTGGDFDLGTSNQDFGGPGIGRGGRRCHPGANKVPQGNVLIVSKDGNSDNPNDNECGGTIRFKFDEIVKMTSVGLLDIEKWGGTIKTFGENGKPLRTYRIPGMGDNSVQDVKLRPDWISEMEITFRGGGAITHLDYTKLYKNTATATIGGASPISAIDSAYAKVVSHSPWH